MPRDRNPDAPPGTRRKPHVLGDYEVGYGRPPKKHQFQPGDRNNPLGRKKKAVSSTGVNVTETLMEPVSLTDQRGRKRLVPYPLAFIQTLKQRALAGNPKAVSAMMELLLQFGVLTATRAEAMKIIIELVEGED